MRAVGVPGGMVMRMLWAETLMISLCAVIMSLVLGLSLIHISIHRQ